MNLFQILIVFPLENPIITGINVIAGGPCSGKTSLIKALSEKGYKTTPETAEQMIKEGKNVLYNLHRIHFLFFFNFHYFLKNLGIRAGISVEKQRRDPVAWQMNLLKKDFNLMDQLANDGNIVVTDTSFIETVVFANR